MLVDAYVGDALDRQRAEEAQGEPWVLHRFSNDLYSFQTPSNWGMVSEGELGMKWKDDANGILLAVTAIPKIDTSIKSLSELHDENLSNFKLNGTEVESFQKSSVGVQVDRSSQDMLVTYAIQSDRTHAFVRHIDFPKHWVSVYFECKPSKYGSNISTMLGIADSVWLSELGNYVIARFDGTYAQSGHANSYPMRLFLLKKNEVGEIEGVLNWPSLDRAGTRFKGTLIGKQFSFTEYEVLAGGHLVVVPTEYKGESLETSMSGKATYKGTVSKFKLNRVEFP